MDLTERGAGVGRHPWELQRFEAYRRVLADHGALTAKRVLDVGAGDGWFSDSLTDSLPSDAEIVCWDVNYDDGDLERTRAGVVRTRNRPTPGYDLVLALDVLEHIGDPVAFIAEELRPLTTRGTAALVAVPAHQRLFGEHDVALGHVRRYGRKELLDLLRPWVDVVEHGSLFTVLLAPRAAQIGLERLAGRGQPAADHGVGGWDGGRLLTSTVNAALRADARVVRWLTARGVKVPGLSVWALGVVR